MKSHDFVPGLPLPADAVTRRLALLATSGAGKTYGAMKLAELMLEAGHQIIALDVAGPWWGLRLGADGVSVGCAVAVLGGTHGDSLLDPGSGALVADALVDTRMSAVLDLSEFSDAEVARFGTAFAERFFERKKAAPSPVHLFIEEAHELMPQNPERDQNLMLNRWKRLTRQGRNHGIGFTLVTQAPQSLNKRCLNLVECVITLRLFGAHERKAVTDWVANVAPDPKKATASIQRKSPYLEDGQCLVWSPAWLHRMGGTPAKICPKRTFDSSKTPEPGDPLVSTLPPPQALDLQQLAAAMQQARAAEALAKAAIGEIKKGERLKPVAQRVEVQVLDPALVAKLDGSVDRLEVLRNEICGALADAQDALEKIYEQLAKVPTSKAKGTEPHRLVAQAGLGAAEQKHRNGHRGRIAAPVDPAAPLGGRPAVERHAVASPTRARNNSPMQRVLDALAWWKSVGVSSPTRLQVAMVCGVKVTGSFESNLGAMLGQHLIFYPQPGRVALTEKGSGLAVQPEGHHTLEALHQKVLAVVARSSGSQERILRELVDVYPLEQSREGLAKVLGIKVTGSFESNLGALYGMGLVTYPRPGHVRAAEVLFPSELRHALGHSAAEERA